MSHEEAIELLRSAAIAIARELDKSPPNGTHAYQIAQDVLWRTRGYAKKNEPRVRDA